MSLKLTSSQTSYIIKKPKKYSAFRYSSKSLKFLIKKKLKEK